ncbi:ATP-dependent DNA helicase RecG [Coprobacter fastidiosus]|uniref:ATP-dependent DNA helicase RecG n=1 Tax=Coprobacter fastidiosus NSB1 = JCM 33896 TaxID=1349822 RepID=A0A495VRG6_9BACT|nr:ATP-dependent DNA helicase RecG [Coprobacter fastidiosus]EHL86051.1 ATP-dependent DNA helicase RecG [Tannerella sp. 6_1_58FAA_CT1]ERM90202.1 ATP-dependent DNA helicase RecG [Coprobacter fastidiosus NSB1 = JCM 33896]RKT50975.1 ATP-dependent DNA helicase RecG [Coprobacter fastidiosus NSB1 = JCM 33896]BEG63389.1 ATP-dependent DNA helicase RecG [Coprobacter fastidiosus]
MSDLSTRDIKFLPGVGPKKAELFNKELKIFSFEDLLYYFPYKYIDRSRTYKIKEIDGNMPYIQLRGEILNFETQGEGKGRRLIARFSDGTGIIELVWFKGIKFIIEKYKPGIEYTLFGKPTRFGSKFNIAHPEIDPIDDIIDKAPGLQAYYSTTEKMKSHFLNSKAIQKIMYNLWKSINGPLPETLPAQVIARSQVIYLTEAIQNIHFPQSPDLLRKAQFRLKFEELFYLQLNILRFTRQRQKKLGGFRFDHIGDYFNNFYHQCLPFELTNAQKRVLREIRADVGSGKQMNRLLQGDVGSGKTLVALMSMLMAVDNGFQACLMAPTEILASQHYESISELVAPIGIHVELLTGSTRKKERERIHEGLLTGDVNLIIGTHALIENTVLFSNLGLVVIDEQHRFGVEQRARLWKKNNRPPHILVMTATPIPRTLAMTVYGDLDVSVIDELPPGRKPIQTIHQYDNKRGALYASIRKQIEMGRQIYIVYPLIQESERSDLKNLEDGFKHIQEVFPEFKVCMVHGKMKPAEKDAEMQKFVSGEAHIMVATTVIEVGVNVPNASVMIIENAERFGLSQLHQLRGRVGRGADQSYCILMTSHKLSQETRKRLEIMVRTNDGFEISEADLQLRGPGDMEGTQQSGIAFDLKIANIAKDGQILQLARDIANEILDKDPELSLTENYVLNRQLQKIFKKKINWSLIS